MRCRIKLEPYMHAGLRGKGRYRENFIRCLAKFNGKRVRRKALTEWVKRWAEEWKLKRKIEEAK